MSPLRTLVVAGTALLLAAGPSHAANLHRADTVVGALAGAGAGALIGHALGGRDGAIAGGAIGAIAGASIAHGDIRQRPVGFVPAPVRVQYRETGHYRHPGYFVGPYAPPPRHSHGFWQRFEDSWGAPYWVWNDARPTRYAPVYVTPPVYRAPPVYAAPPVYVAPAPVYVGPSHPQPPRIFRHPERHFEGAASPHRPDPRYVPDGRRHGR